MDTLWWEDLAVPGQVRALGQVTVDAAEALEFARRYDPQPFHLDEQAARASMFGAISASGWHTCAMAMRLTVDNLLCQSSSLGSPGLENVRWMRPVYPGDTLSLSWRVLDARPMASKPGIGLVRSVWDMRNQHGQQVLHMEGWGMFRRRPADGRAGAHG